MLACALPLLAAAQSAGITVTVSSPSQDAERQLAAAYRQRGFTVTETATVTRTVAGSGWSFTTASSPMFQTFAPTDVTSTVFTAVAHKNGAPQPDVFAAEGARCNELLQGAAGTCKVESTGAR